MLIDGHSVAFPSTGGNGLGPELIPLSAVERVEIIRGPASALYGADAFLGVVNIQTRSGKSRQRRRRLAGGRAGGRQPGHATSTCPLGIERGRRRRAGGRSAAPARTCPACAAGQLAGAHHARLQLRRARRRAWTRPSTSALATRDLPARRRAPSSGCSATSRSMHRGAEFGSLFQLANGYNDRHVSENRVSQWQLRGGPAVGPGRWRADCGCRCAAPSSRASPATDNRLEVGSEFYYVRRRFGFRGAGPRRASSSGRPTAAACALVAGASRFLDDEQLPSRIGVAKQPIEDAQPGDVIDAISIYQGRKTFVNAGAYLQGTWDADRPTGWG